MGDSSTETQQSATTESTTTDDPTDQNTDEPANEALDLSSLTTYANDVVGYRIKYPEHWVVDERYQFVITISNRS